jgi:hypothetical protein
MESGMKNNVDSKGASVIRLIAGILSSFLGLIYLLIFLFPDIIGLGSGELMNVGPVLLFAAVIFTGIIGWKKPALAGVLSIIISLSQMSFFLFARFEPNYPLTLVTGIPFLIAGILFLLYSRLNRKSMLSDKE